MRVLYIIDYGTIGGATKAFIDLVLSEKALGVLPIVITSQYNEINELLDSYRISNISAGHYTVLEPFKIKSIRSLWWLLKMLWRYYSSEKKAYKTIMSKINFDNIDIVHSNTNRCTLGCYINKRHKIPHIMHIREFSDKDFGCISLRPFYVDYFNKYTTSFISVSNAVKDYWNSKGIRHSKNHCIYDGVADKDIIRSTCLKNRNIKMVIVGGVCKAKGQLIAVKSFEYLPLTIRNNISLDIIGWADNEYLNEIIETISNLNLSQNIHYLGSMQSVHKELCNYNVGLMCSISEGFGLVTAEYMLAGLGVIASNSGANPELISNNETGLLFETNNPKDLAESIVKYYNDRDLLLSCSNNAYNKAKMFFTSTFNANQIYNEYKQVLNQL